MNKQITDPFAIVYCEHCKNEFPISKVYANRRLSKGFPILCGVCVLELNKEVTP